jgi:hypothetical protein
MLWIYDIAVKRLLNTVSVNQRGELTGSGFKVMTQGASKLRSSAVIKSNAAQIAYCDGQ